MLLRNAWKPAGLALVAGGLIWSFGPVLASRLFILMAGGAARVWADRSLRGVELERLLPESRAFPGEQVRLTYRLTNRALLPLPWLEVRDLLPEALAPPALGLPSAEAGAKKIYRRSTHLRWYERTTWSLDLPCPKRGPVGRHRAEDFRSRYSHKRVPTVGASALTARSISSPHRRKSRTVQVPSF